VHSHVHHFTGHVLRLAWKFGVPNRIAHSHNDTSVVDAEAGVARKAYLRLMERWIRTYATSGLAASQKAAKALYRSSWGVDSRWRVQPYGIDLTQFHEAYDGASLRRELGVPGGALVIGHVGRFYEQKNHPLLLKIFDEVRRRLGDSHLLLVGDGPLRPSIQQLSRDLGLAGTVTFAGVRRDVPCIMRGAMDMFVLPSLFEGLPLVLMEAQAAGLPVVVSDAVSDEADVVSESIRRISVSAPPSHWADAIVQLERNRPNASWAHTVARMENSPFNIQKSVAALEQFYQSPG
jgi:glycosyltransferase involved in cell wall biosynthesis